MASIVSGLASLSRPETHERPITSAPINENCWRIAIITCDPPPPLCVPNPTGFPVHIDRKLCQSKDIQEIALLSVGGYDPLYSGASTTHAFASVNSQHTNIHLRVI